jgi:predicted nucleic acid-binding protein
MNDDENETGAEKRLFVDASVFITLAETDYVDLLDALDGEVVVPRAVAEEIVDEPAASHLDAANDDWLSIADAVECTSMETVEHAASHLGIDPTDSGPGPTDSGSEPTGSGSELDFEGDVALLAFGTAAENPVVVTDDKPLRDACKALSVPLSGSIGVLVAAVERGRLDPDEAKEALVAMDEVGARLSARLLRRAEKLVEQAAE